MKSPKLETLRSLAKKNTRGGGDTDRMRLDANCLSSVRQNEEDIISSLPDPILSHILSFLPIRESVRTGVLSSRWRTLWTLVPVLDLNQDTVEDPVYRFEDIVSRIWSFRNAISIPMPLQKLRIYWVEDCLPFYVDTWVRVSILQGGLQHLDLTIAIRNQPRFELPRTVFFCSTLVVLKLMGQILLNPPTTTAYTFPSLRILQVEYVRYANCNSLSTLLAACPVLQDFTLTMENLDCDEAGKFNIIVVIPTLKNLLLNLQFFPYKLQIKTPALEYFYFLGLLDKDHELEYFPCLVKSVLYVLLDSGMNVVDYAKTAWDFVGRLHNIASMELCLATAEILSHASKNDHVALFHNLSSLKFKSLVSPPWYLWLVVRRLLCRAPKLQILAFESDRAFSCYTHANFSEEPLDVPECLSSHLTTCHYQGFSNYYATMELVRQILKAARVLKKMKITLESQLRSKEKRCLRKEIMNIPRSSETCQIVFD